MKVRAAIAFLALLMLSGIVSAGESKPFSQAEFDRLTKAGQPVVVDVWASWCPTCKAQKPILENLLGRRDYKDVTLLKVDFDTEKRALLNFKVAKQSTLIGFKGTEEVGRSVGDTTEAGVESLIKKTLP